jgi:hypothetical protein
VGGIVTADSERETTYHCVVGHEIPSTELETRTEVWVFDGGAKVHVCAEHGAPIALTRQPLARENQSA